MGVLTSSAVKTVTDCLGCSLFDTNERQFERPVSCLERLDVGSVFLRPEHKLNTCFDMASALVCEVHALSLTVHTV